MPSDTQGLLVAASAARTAATTFGPFTNPAHNALVLIIDTSAAVDSPEVTFTIQGVDPISGATYTILASTAITDGTTTRVLRVSPHLTASNNLIAKDYLPHLWQVAATVADADSLTYSIYANLYH